MFELETLMGGITALLAGIFYYARQIRDEMKTQTNLLRWMADHMEGKGQ